MSDGTDVAMALIAVGVQEERQILKLANTTRATLDRMEAAGWVVWDETVRGPRSYSMKAEGWREVARRADMSFEDMQAACSQMATFVGACVRLARHRLGEDGAYLQALGVLRATLTEALPGFAKDLRPGE